MMKKIFLLVIILYYCTARENNTTKDFSTKAISNEEWATYEGKWIAEKGIISLELALQKNPSGVNSYYKLHESLVEAKRASSFVGFVVMQTYGRLLYCITPHYDIVRAKSDKPEI